MFHDFSCLSLWMPVCVRRTIRCAHNPLSWSLNKRLYPGENKYYLIKYLSPLPLVNWQPYLTGISYKVEQCYQHKADTQEIIWSWHLFLNGKDCDDLNNLRSQHPVGHRLAKTSPVAALVISSPLHTPSASWCVYLQRHCGQTIFITCFFWEAGEGALWISTPSQPAWFEGHGNPKAVKWWLSWRSFQMPLIFCRSKSGEAFFCHVHGIVLSCTMAGLWEFGHGICIFRVKRGLLDSGEGQTFARL